MEGMEDLVMEIELSAQGSPVDGFSCRPMPI
jgi:hypothetical protein